MNSDFTKGFLAGFGVALVLLVGLIFMAVFWFTGPALDVSATAPETAVQGERFTLSIEIHNPHGDDIELDNIDVPDRVLENFDINPVDPESLGEAIGGLGSLTWFPEWVLEPGDSATVEFDVRALSLGRQVLELEVCNDFEECTQIVRVIDVTTP